MIRPIAAALILLLIAGAVTDAHAYLDPGTGNYVLQVLLAAGFAALFYIKIFFKEIKRALQSIFKKAPGK